jgi:hypothetical protein
MDAGLKVDEAVDGSDGGVVWRVCLAIPGITDSLEASGTAAQ